MLKKIKGNLQEIIIRKNNIFSIMDIPFRFIPIFTIFLWFSNIFKRITKSSSSQDKIFLRILIIFLTSLTHKKGS